MDGQFLTMVIKIAVFLPFIIFLIYIALKYGGSSLQKMQNGRFIKIVERVPISKDNSIMVVKMGTKSYIVTSTSQNVQILKELGEEEEFKLEESKVIPEYKNLKDLYSNLVRKGR